MRHWLLNAILGVVESEMLAGYKTYIINGLLAIFGILSAIFGPVEGAPDAKDVELLLDSADGIVVSIISIVNLILRTVTKTPVFWKANEPTA